MDCCSPSDSELICGNYKGIRKSLRRRCWNRYEHNNKPWHKFTNTSTIVKASPAKAMEKIETVTDNLHARGKYIAKKQLLSRFLWNRSMKATRDAKIRGGEQV